MNDTFPLRRYRSLSVRPLLLAAFLLLSPLAHAANHYVRPGAGGPGSDWNNASPTLPATLVRGDTYYVASGNYPGATLANAAGTTGTITIKKATPADHGTDTGWQAAFGTGAAVWGNMSCSLSNLVFDGVTGADKNGYGFEIYDDASKGPLFRFDSAPQHVTISHCELHTKDRLASTDDAIYGDTPCQNITVSWCYIHDIGRCPVLMRNWNNLVLEHCWIARNHSTPAQHAEGISTHGGGGHVIRYNHWEDIEGTAIIVNLADPTSNWQIYGNCFFQTPGGNCTGVGHGIVGDNFANSGINGLKFYNNSAYNITGVSSGLRFWGSGAANIVATNNLWANCQAVGFSNVAHDYNSYANCTTSFEFKSGAGAHEAVAGGNPFVNAAAGDFHLTAATASGIEFGSPWNVDPDGKARGSAGGNWDRGAYQFGGTAAPATSTTQATTPASTSAPGVMPTPGINQAAPATPGATPAILAKPGSKPQRYVNNYAPAATPIAKPTQTPARAAGRQPIYIPLVSAKTKPTPTPTPAPAPTATTTTQPIAVPLPSPTPTPTPEPAPAPGVTPAESPTTASQPVYVPIPSVIPTTIPNGAGVQPATQPADSASLAATGSAPGADAATAGGDATGTGAPTGAGASPATSPGSGARSSGGASAHGSSSAGNQSSSAASTSGAAHESTLSVALATSGSASHADFPTPAAASTPAANPADQPSHASSLAVPSVPNETPQEAPVLAALPPSVAPHSSAPSTSPPAPAPAEPVITEAPLAADAVAAMQAATGADGPLAMTSATLAANADESHSPAGPTHKVELRPSPPGAKRTPDLQSGLVAAYSFDELAHAQVSDLSGHANTGKVEGAAWSPAGFFGGCMVFDGQKDQITVSNSASLALKDGMTLEAWIFPINNLDGWRNLIAKELDAGKGADYYLYASTQYKQPAAGIFTGGEVLQLGGASPELNTWTHLAATYDGKQQKVYMNGKLIAERAQTGPIRQSAGPLRIGGNGTWGEHFLGRIDEVRIYNRALAAEEIEQDMATPIR